MGQDRVPDGIEERHHHLPGALRRPKLASLVVTGAILLAAMAGLAGGTPNPSHVVDGPAARLEVTTPSILRNGLFYETRIHIVPHRAFDDLVLGVEPSLWRDMTVNSAIPAAEKESFGGGIFRLSFGPAKAGERIELKFDGQINPPLFGGNRGRIALFDGERPVAALSLKTRVLP
jgi:hypothetical protein